MKPDYDYDLTIQQFDKDLSIHFDITFQCPLDRNYRQVLHRCRFFIFTFWVT